MNDVSKRKLRTQGPFDIASEAVFYWLNHVAHRCGCMQNVMDVEQFEAIVAVTENYQVYGGNSRSFYEIKMLSIMT